MKSSVAFATAKRASFDVFPTSLSNFNVFLTRAYASVIINQLINQSTLLYFKCRKNDMWNRFEYNELTRGSMSSLLISNPLPELLRLGTPCKAINLFCSCTSATYLPPTICRNIYLKGYISHRAWLRGCTHMDIERRGCI